MSKEEPTKSSPLEMLGIGEVGEGVADGPSTMFNRAFDRRVRIAMGVIAASLTIFIGFGVYVNWPSNREAGYMPEQPLDYSHKTHAGDLGIECQYCHSNAAKGPHATVPPISTCMKCHLEVQPKGPDGKLKPGVATLLDHWNNKKPLAWTKVNDVADFVYFDHSRHVLKEIECQECHGPVETFEHMKRQHGLKMSWCIDCHSQPEKKPDGKGGFIMGLKAPINCATCHR
jgi:hypothetical protein